MWSRAVGVGCCGRLRPVVVGVGGGSLLAGGGWVVAVGVGGRYFVVRRAYSVYRRWRPTSRRLI